MNLKVTCTGQPSGEILSATSRPPSPVGDGVAGPAVVQSGGLTHWDRFKSQCNLTLSGRTLRAEVRLKSGWVTASQTYMRDGSGS